jgi:hypothetical protein
MKKYRVSIRDVNTELYETGVYEGTSTDEVTDMFLLCLNSSIFLRFPNNSFVSVKYIVSFKIVEVSDA